MIETATVLEQTFDGKVSNANESSRGDGTHLSRCMNANGADLGRHLGMEGAVQDGTIQNVPVWKVYENNGPQIGVKVSGSGCIF